MAYGTFAYGTVAYASMPATSTDTTAPTVDITTSPDLVKISRVSGKDTSTFAFTVNEDYQAYKLKIVTNPTDPHTAGTLVESGSGGLSGVARIVNVTDDEIEAAQGGISDGVKRIKVFVQDMAGNWSE